MSGGVFPFAMGWMPDLPDIHDYSPEHEKIVPMLQPIMKSVKELEKPKKKVDLRAFCSPLENQGNLGSCTAHAAMGLLEYFQNKAFGTFVDGSRLFLYKATRNLLGWTGDTGAYIRTTMGAMVLFGVAQEKYWPYDVSKFEEEPPAFCYAMGQQYKATKYFRLDPVGIAPNKLLESIKTMLASGVPAMFGFVVYDSIKHAEKTGRIPFPTRGDSRRGGHAVCAMGYDDTMEIENPQVAGSKTKGALLIRNSWGTGWGDEGYGWLPYEYVLKGLAVDWWSLMDMEWVNTGNFGF